MRTLYLVRHAKSDHDVDLSDIDRPLNARGYRDANNMSILMRNKNLLPDTIISSPAIRAITTALIFSRNLKFNPSSIVIADNLYETGVKQYSDVISKCATKHKSIMLFAHNPTISDFANSLISSFNENIPTCGIVGITNNSSDWKNFIKTTSELSLYDFPKNNITGVK